LTGVPWLSLQAGDVVNIYYRATPYLTKFALQAQGTAAAPIVINGVTDASCDRPIVSGKNAVTATDAITSGFFTTSGGSLVENQGLIVMLWGPTQAYATSPKYITLQNLEFTGAASGNSFTDHTGATKSWAGGSAIYAVIASNFTIQNCLITGNDEGVFFNSQDSQRTSYYVTLRANVIYGNGVNGSFLFHNIYGQGYRTLYEGNFIGEVMAGSVGSSLKDRSSGTVVRNNYIEASARALDLVDTQASSVVSGDPLYNYAWVYGNIIVDDFSTPSNSTDLIHWGGDSDGDATCTVAAPCAGDAIYRNGTLYYYFNTMIIKNDTTAHDRVGVFDMSSNLQSVEARSNIFWFTNNSANATIEMGICCGTVSFADTNWISTGWQPSVESGNTVTVNQNGTLIQGSSPLLNTDFTLSSTSGSAVLGKGVLAPTGVPSGTAALLSLSDLQPTWQYLTQALIVARPNTKDLGAYAAH
jgi:hypothetical protein